MRLTNPNKHPRLHLPVPDGTTWRIHQIGPNLTEADVDDHVSFRVRALVAPTVEHTAWIEGIMLEGAPEGTRLERVAMQPMLSPRGWPLVFAHYKLLDGGGKVFASRDSVPASSTAEGRCGVIEERAGAFYGIVHNRAEVVVRCKGVAWRDREAELKPYMLSAHVEWPEYDSDLVYTLLGFELG